ncbi:TonB-dependent receptor [Flaviaesturariibacter amylovorans]|uniref:Outer membrane beta-barrel family protein n=1 Tax=Flaviaesturariibacter amylovorans TaxID=1084520 RepID=A0ABP8HE72_9BACT
MKTILLYLVLFLLPAGFLHAQSLQGRLTDEKGTPLAYANIALLRADSSLAAGAMTGTDGRFTIKAPAAGSYRLRYTAIGYRDLVSATRAISADTDLGTLALKADGKQLDEVTVQSLRPAIEQKADRLVVNVENTAMAAGNTAYAVLARTPGVLIDAEGNIQLNGRSGVTVMIDGRPTFLSARDLRTMLEGMPAENLKNIEIITNPSSKYEAEGTSGILNLNLKRQTVQGMTGAVYMGYNTNFYNSGWSTGASINMKKGGWSFFANVDLMRRVGGRNATFTRVFRGSRGINYFDQVAEANHYNEGPPTVRLGSDWQLNKRHSIGFTAYFNQNTLRQQFDTRTVMGPAPGTADLVIDARNRMMNVWQGMTGNAHYVFKLDSAGSTLTADVDGARIRNRGDADFYNYYDSVRTGKPVETDFLYQNSPNGYNIVSGRVDLTLMLPGNRRFETGVRASDVLSDNDARFYFNNTGLVPDPARTNHFRYTENIYAAYVNWSMPLSKRLTLQTGLRAEQTVSRGTQLTTGQVTNRKYTDLFPTVFLQQQVSDRYSINWSYSRRLQRPNYGNLNPFRLYRDPYTWFEGNPYLRPQYAHSFSVTQSVNKTYLFTLSYLYTKDIMSELPRIVPDSSYTIYYTGNVSSEREVGLTAVVPVKIRRWWDVQNTLTVLGDRIEFNDKGVRQVNENVFVMLQSNHTLQLPRGIRAELNGRYVGPGLTGLYQMEAYFRLDVALRKSFTKAGLDLSVNAGDVFNTHRLRFNTNIDGNINNFDQMLRFRNLNVTLRYNFRKGVKVEEQRRRNVEELNRAGG